MNRVGFIRKTGLSPLWISVLFLLKVAAGIFYGWYYTQIPDFKNEADTWKFYYESLEALNILKTAPLQFFTDVFLNADSNSYLHFFSSADTFWSLAKHEFMVKLMAVFNLLSGSNYYTNVIFYSFLTFFGPVAFLRVMKDVFPDRLPLLSTTIFLFPSFLFWCSGIHKDGIIFLLLALAIYSFYFGLKYQRTRLFTILPVLICMGLCFLVRNYVALAFTPFFFAWWKAEKKKRRKWTAFLKVCLIGIIVFFGTKLFFPKIDFPQSVVMRNQEFIRLGGESMMPQRELLPTFNSFLMNATQALNHSLVRPFITEIRSPFYFLCAIEILFIWILIFIWYFRFKENPFEHSVVLTTLIGSFIVLLLIGYIVPQIGAIVRYRSIFIPFIVAPIVATTRWEPKY
jgi:hypothetical protein